MNFWNPQNKQYIYFHICRADDDFYVRVDTIKQEAWKLLICEQVQRGQSKQKGIYKLKWSTFITGIASDLNQRSRAWKKKCEKQDGHPRTWVKYTTKNQWQKAYWKLLAEIN